MAVRDAGAGGQYLIFNLGSEEYAIGILRASEIVRCDSLAAAPSGPPWLRGLLRVREAAVPVVDLAVRFGWPARPVTTQTCAVLLATGRTASSRVGLLADEVREVVDLRAEDIEALPRFGPRVHVDGFVGMAKAGERLVLLLDTDHLLASEEVRAALAAADGACETGSAPWKP